MVAELLVFCLGALVATHMLAPLGLPASPRSRISNSPKVDALPGDVSHSTVSAYLESQHQSTTLHLGCFPLMLQQSLIGIMIAPPIVIILI